MWVFIPKHTVPPITHKCMCEREQEKENDDTEQIAYTIYGMKDRGEK